MSDNHIEWVPIGQVVRIHPMLEVPKAVIGGSNPNCVDLYCMSVPLSLSMLSCLSSPSYLKMPQKCPRTPLKKKTTEEEKISMYKTCGEELLAGGVMRCCKCLRTVISNWWWMWICSALLNSNLQSYQAANFLVSKTVRRNDPSPTQSLFLLHYITVRPRKIVHLQQLHCDHGVAWAFLRSNLKGAHVVSHFRQIHHSQIGRMTKVHNESCSRKCAVCACVAQ